ncbi:MAG: GNAT family N-acetyltransferase [Burkholderiales bacterium]
MTADLTVRAARADDLPAITAIYAHHVRHGAASFELAPPDAAEMRQRYDAIRALGWPYLVAERGGEVVGYAYAALYRTRPAYRYTAEDSVYVRHDLAGHGIGARLMPALIAACETAGIRQLIAVIGDSANLGSVRLHEKFGFAAIGVLPAVGWKFGRWVDSVLMQRAIGDGADSGAPEG